MKHFFKCTLFGIIVLASAFSGIYISRTFSFSDNENGAMVVATGVFLFFIAAGFFANDLDKGEKIKFQTKNP
ncbi:hypothetical protein JYU20_00660 [Bacteroidales bacterium AH-315-I05]|nr:hypothetical protein [Bacteroidales bacterium AH-315-I05]